jgi:hypothetical protein
VRGNFAEGEAVVARALSLYPTNAEAMELQNTFRAVKDAGDR